MKLAIITPTSYINKFGNQGDFHLALSHLLDRDTPNEYEKALLESDMQIILDNGLFENHVPEGIDSLIAKAKRIKATHFFAPDHLYNKERTQSALENTIHVLDQQKLVDKIKIAAVVQADNPKDYIRQYIDFCNNPDVDLIGLSILSIPKSFEVETHTNSITLNRIHLLKKLKELEVKHTDCHMLGLGDNYSDVKFAKDNCPWVVSNDTSSCFQNGLFGRSIKDGIVEGGKIKDKVDFDLGAIELGKFNLIQDNINNVKFYVYSEPTINA
jgi:hypothetical protein